MSSLQDAINAHREELQAVTSSQKQELNGEVLGSTIEQSLLPVSTPVQYEIDEDSLADIIHARMARREQFVAMRDARDAKLEQHRIWLEKSEMNLRELYREKPKAEKILSEEVGKLAEAKQVGWIDDISVLETGVQAFHEDLANVVGAIMALETRYPALKAKLEEERVVIAAHKAFLQCFIKEMDKNEVRYTVKGTVTPSVTTINESYTFLEMSIKKASEGYRPLIVLADKGQTPLFVHDGKRWTPKYPQLLEGVEVCKELTVYREAVHAAKQKKLQQLADEDVTAGLLLTPQDVAQQKNAPQNCQNIVNMIRCRSGFCFIPVMSKKSTELSLYRAVLSELKVEYEDNPEGAERHMLRVSAVTTPQFVEDFFFPEEGKGSSVKPIFYLNDRHELSTWRRINSVVRDSIANAVRWAEAKEREIVAMEELGNVSSVNNLRTLHQLADGAVGIAIIHAPKPRYGNGFAIGFQMVSDGVTVCPGSRATDKSKKLSVYEAILDGKPVAEFFARAKDGSFINEELQEIAVRNEAFELDWLMPIIATRHNAEQMSCENATFLVLPTSEGGRDGIYVFRVSTTEKRGEKDEKRREVAYVVTREGDKLTFIEGLTPCSVICLTEQGFALNTPYMIGELRGFVLHVLRKVYCDAFDVRYDDLPEHLKGGWMRAQSSEC